MTAGAPGVCGPGAFCGDGVLDAGEGCDDGNTVDGDGCNAGCFVENGGACNEVAPGNLGSGSCPLRSVMCLPEHLVFAVRIQAAATVCWMQQKVAMTAVP